MNVASAVVAVAPGDGVVFRKGGVLLMMFSDPASGQGLLDAVGDGAAAGVGGRSLAYRIAGLLADAGPGGTPPFGLLADDADGIAAFVHGAVTMRALGEESPVELSGADSATWVDRILSTTYDRIEVTADGAVWSTSSPFVLAEGMVPAGAVALTAGDEPVPAARPAEVEQLPAEKPEPVAEEPEVEQLPAEKPEPAVEQQPFEAIDLTTTTQSRPALSIAGTEEAEPEAPQEEAELIEGVNCIRGHFNHPAARFCAHCGISMVQQTAALVSGVRPPLGLLVFSNGRTLALDADYVLGRDPSGDQVVLDGSARPFQLDDPDQTLSRVHLEISLVGWDANVIDRDSANGTFLRREDGEWERLAPGQPSLLAPGSQVRIGPHELTFDSHHLA